LIKKKIPVFVRDEGQGILKRYKFVANGKLGLINLKANKPPTNGGGVNLQTSIFLWEILHI